MANNKIQITLPVDTLDLLKKDAASFGFYRKKDNKINLNDFLNTLFANYYDSFLRNRDNIQKEITKKLDNALNDVNKKIKEKSETPNTFEIPEIQKDYKDELIQEIVLFTESKFLLEDVKKKETKSFTLLIHKDNQRFYDSKIQEIKSSRTTKSEFFRKLFISYSSLSLEKRELIIFKLIAEKLLTAIQSKKQVKITTDQKTLTVSPIALCPTNTDPFNYLVSAIPTTHYYRLYNFRLASIKYVSILDEKNLFSSEQIEKVEKRSKNTINSEPRLHKTFIKIHFSEIGIVLFENLHDSLKIVHEDINNRIYTFFCTPSECAHFLRNFKEEAIIIEPTALAISIQNELCSAKLCKFRSQLEKQKSHPQNSSFLGEASLAKLYVNQDDFISLHKLNKKTDIDNERD